MEAHEFKALRENAGKTQEEAARALQVTVARVSRWERGESRISPLMDAGIRKILAPESVQNTD